MGRETFLAALLEKTSALLNHLTVFGMMTIMSVSMFALSRFPLFLLITMLDSKLSRLMVLLVSLPLREKDLLIYSLKKLMNKVS
jgi:hypothetical protein